MTDALANFKPKGSGLYLKFEADDEVRMRLLTLDPLVSESSWENGDGETVVSTKYGFVIWNWNEGKAQIMQVGPGLVKRFTQIHTSNDYDPINKIDIKITATGDGLKRRYTVDVLPTPKEMSNDMIKEAADIKLEEAVKDIKGRLSELEDDSDNIEIVKEVKEKSGYEKAREVASNLGKDETEDETFDPETIPF
jgi:hypothetical protein